MRGAGVESARMAWEVGLAPAMGILRKPLPSGFFPPGSIDLSWTAPTSLQVIHGCR